MAEFIPGSENFLWGRSCSLSRTTKHAWRQSAVAHVMRPLPKLSYATECPVNRIRHHRDIQINDGGLPILAFYEADDLSFLNFDGSHCDWVRPMSISSIQYWPVKPRQYEIAVCSFT